MTPERAKELLPIIQAFTEGKQIQNSITRDKWYDCQHIVLSDLTNTLIKWRVKPEKQTGWTILYRTCNNKLITGVVYSSKEEALNSATPGCIACIQISFEEGEGL